MARHKIRIRYVVVSKPKYTNHLSGIVLMLCVCHNFRCPCFCAIIRKGTARLLCYNVYRITVY